MKLKIINLLLILWLFQTLAAQEAKFYGYIYKYPVTMNIEIKDNEKIDGYYFYDKQKKTIDLTGNLLRKDDKIHMQTKNGEENFAGYIMDYNSKKQGRIIGRWKYKNKDLPFELRRKPFKTEDNYYFEKTGLNIKLDDDKKLEAKEMEVFPDIAFIYEPDLGSGAYPGTQVDYSPGLQDEKFMKKILELTETIRSEFQGSYRFTGYRRFLFKLLKYYYAPQEVLQNKEIDSEYAKEINDYFQRWSFGSIYNYNKYKEFRAEEKELKKALISFYEQKYNLNDSDCQKLADGIILIIQSRAYGSAPYCELSHLLENIINNEKKSKILESIKFETDDEELYVCLNACILLKRDKEIITTLLQKIKHFDLMEESPLSCAIDNIDLLNFLLKNYSDKLNVNHKNWFGKTPIFYAIQYSQHDAVNALIEYGAHTNVRYNTEKKNYDVNYSSQIYYTQRTPFMHAAQHSDVKMLKILIQKRAYINALDERKNNALIYAEMGKKPENIQYLKTIGLKSK